VTEHTGEKIIVESTCDVCGTHMITPAVDTEETFKTVYHMCWSCKEQQPFTVQSVLRGPAGGWQVNGL
jgi:hypothetical protein